MSNVIQFPSGEDYVNPILKDECFTSSVLRRTNEVSPYLLKPLRSYQQAANDYNLKRMREILSVLRKAGINPWTEEK